MSVRIIGVNDQKSIQPYEIAVNTTSQSPELWSRALSPFNLGPCRLYDGYVSLKMENAWQFSKVFADQVALNGQPSDNYWKWAASGWASDKATRYPRGKGAKPEFIWWNGEKLSYLEARLKVYWPLYRDALRETEAFKQLQRYQDQAKSLVLIDFDGYDHDKLGIPLGAVIRQTNKPMGHAFIIKAMLLHGVHVCPEDVPDTTQVQHSLL